MRTSGGEGSTTSLVDVSLGRQAQRLFGKLGSFGRRASVGGEDRGLVQRCRDVGVRFVSGHRQMARANDRIVDYLCNPRVNAPAVVAEVAVERRRQQWMREVDRPVATFDDLGGDGRVERPGCDAYPRWEGRRVG